MRILAAALFVVSSLAFGQSYPTKPVTIIVPYPAGGPTDTLARQVAQRFTEKLGQPFVVEDITGGNTLIATGRVAKAPGDGYTLLLHNLQISANVTLYPDAPYNTERDLTTVGFINRNPLVMVGRKGLPPNNLTELIPYMRKNNLNIAHPGAGATGHLATTLFLQEAKLKATMVPYRGAAPAMQNILGEQVDLFLSTPQAVVKLVQAGRIKAYGITTKEKYPQFPNVSSFVTEVSPKLEIFYWQALFAPSKTPKAIIEKLNAVLQEFEDDPAIMKGWDAEGVSAFPKDERSVERGQKVMKSEIARWRQVIQDNHIEGPQ
ncbi:MAG TPA: tripartite tricarboxylate transporter substrate-binding protein [Burkholderiales bacterium]|nr:tripartite tricarboxylate transporter substrate-binding protein [Burkholderiales bacterium]